MRTPLKKSLAEDKVYLKNIKALNQIESKDRAWVEELESLHSRRGVRALNSTELLQSAQRISIDSNVDNQAVRSRCVEIKIRALKQEIVIQEKLKYLRSYLRSQYKNLMAERGIKTVTDQKNHIEALLAKYNGLTDRLKFVSTVADLIIADSDAAGFTLKRINDTLEQRSREK